MGTPGFMSPEQMRGLPLDGRSDLYSLGCVLYELLTGVPPFPVMASAEVSASHLYKPVPPLREARPDLSLPEHLEAVVMKALEKLPERRPPDATTLRQELLAVLDEPMGAPAPKKRGEGKKTERGFGLGPAQLEVPVPRPVAGGLPVGVLASGGSPTENSLVMSLSACGFQARVASAGEPLGGFGALLVVAGGQESLVQARALAARPGTPPVLLCGPSDDWELVTGALEGGLFDFVPLPVDPIDLIRKVSRAQKLKR